MKKIEMLRAQLAAKRAEARKLHDENEAVWTDELQAKFDALMADIDSVQAAIDREYKLLGLENPENDPLAVAASAAAARIQMEDKPVYRNIGEQLVDVYAMTVDAPEAPMARERFQKVVKAAGLESGVDSQGGYVIEKDKSATIIQTAVETGVFTSRASRQPIGPNSDSFEYMRFDDRDRSTGKMMGGIDVFRKGESTLLSQESSAKLKPNEIRVEDMYALLPVTNRMLRDAVALTGMVRRMVPKQFAFKLDEELFEGNGVGRCLGITKSALLVSVAKETEQVADTVVVQNIFKMLARFIGNMATSAWFINRDVFPQLPQLVIGTIPVYLPGGSVAGAPFGTLQGLPIVPTEHNETLGDKGDIMLADWSEYLLVEKGDVEEAESIHVRFLYDETMFRFIARNNGQPLFNAPITPKKGANTLSPFVTLDAR